MQRSRSMWFGCSVRISDAFVALCGGGVRRRLLSSSTGERRPSLPAVLGVDAPAWHGKLVVHGTQCASGTELCVRISPLPLIRAFSGMISG